MSARRHEIARRTKRHRHNSPTRHSRIIRRKLVHSFVTSVDFFALFDRVTLSDRKPITRANMPWRLPESIHDSAIKFVFPHSTGDGKRNLTVNGIVRVAVNQYPAGISCKPLSRIFKAVPNRSFRLRGRLTKRFESRRSARYSSALLLTTTTLLRLLRPLHLPRLLRRFLR